MRALIILTIIMASISVVNVANAIVGEKPNVPITGAVITEINMDYLRVEVNLSNIRVEGQESLIPSIETTNKRLRKLNSTNEVYLIAEFGCNLYNRTAVAMSQYYDSINLGAGDQTITGVKYLFACAIP